MRTWPNQGAAANVRPAFPLNHFFDFIGFLSARRVPLAHVAELGRQALARMTTELRLLSASVILGLAHL
jgi:hypothetical protein